MQMSSIAPNCLMMGIIALLDIELFMLGIEALFQPCAAIH